MSKSDLDKMSYRDLRELENRIAQQIAVRKKAEKTDVQRKVRKMIADSGFDLGEIVGTAKGTSRKGVKVAPKYRNPKNPDETWTGRGRQPKWLVAQLNRGRSLQSYLIKK